MKKYHAPGRFLTFLGYEWSGTTPTGGDHNIYFLSDDQRLHRSYSWQIGMEDADGSDRSPISELWEEFSGRRDVMAIPHVGGRYANLDFHHPDFIHLIEIHSHHGTFEWFFEEALKRGLKVGVVAGSDDHTCRPGLSFPTRRTSRGLSSFDVRGGYTGVYARELTREAIWGALNRRHCYATTGTRMLLDVRCDRARMGDEITIDQHPRLKVEVVAGNPIAELEIKRGLETICSLSDRLPRNENKIRIEWSGVRIRSRSKKTDWTGRLIVNNGRIKNLEALAFDQRDEGVEMLSRQTAAWKSSTSGDIDGLEVELDYDHDTRVIFHTGPVSFSFHPDELKQGPLIREAGGVNQRVRVSLAANKKEKTINLEHTDKDPQRGMNPYWVRVVQHDGQMAWSSPIYIRRD